LGIIGRNGAGKSTLLKLLSRITAPTTGSVALRGRVASLLEVGTGMHPDLTGRENIYLNGTILGMRKKEIDNKLDAIVDFSGVERYIDTPVKRYSSGMHVRLGFAVAAHLEPDILIVDEVLAVGDIEFQKKCLGKMKDVSETHGRTILFVSHNLAALRNICNRGIVLQDGGMFHDDTIENAITAYTGLQSDCDPQSIAMQILYPGLSISNVLVNGQSMNEINLGENTKLDIEITGFLKEKLPLNLEVRLFDNEHYPLAFYSKGHRLGAVQELNQGDFFIRENIQLPDNMNKGNFILSIDLTRPGNTYYAKGGEINLIWEGISTNTGIVFDAKKTGWLLLK
jgi:lipopolysaccharide transport system ATP-binding protein